MARPWTELRNRMSSAARKRVDARVRRTLASLPLAEIRTATGITQVELARSLRTGQGGVSRIENAADMYLSTLRRVIEAMGGDLTLTASFPDGRSFEIDAVAGLSERVTQRARKRSLRTKSGRGARRAA